MRKPVVKHNGDGTIQIPIWLAAMLIGALLGSWGTVAMGASTWGTYKERIALNTEARKDIAEMKVTLAEVRADVKSLKEAQGISE